ncbi:MAG TPA: Na+/H+ antiporter [Gaiellaceae bacterium]|nr:Na+/H+ antiporter [Gaiellaceae bacterium]
MDFTTHDQLLLLALLVAMVVLLVAAPIVRIPYPIFLVLGGLALGFVPGIPSIELPPDVVLVAVLPPLVYSAAYYTSLRDLRANARPLALLSIGLVIFTTLTVAVAAHELVGGFSWSAAFVLGAVVSPTDPLAATQIAHRLGVPRRVIAIIEGEGLINDGTALVLYKVAVAAVVAGTFSLVHASLLFVWSVVGGIGIGLVVGYLIAAVRRPLNNPPVEVTISLMSGYFAFIPAAAAHASGVLAVVAAGVYLGWHTPELTNVQSRLQGEALWEILTFVINALLFAVVGLQLPHILDDLKGTSTTSLADDALIVCGAVILTRIVWVPVFTYLPRWLFPRIRARDPYPPLSYPIVISWAGLRGAVSLAAALALPLTTRDGSDFAERNLIVFLTFCVIFATLVVQGLTLPGLIRLLGLEDDGVAEREDAKARIKAAEAALARLDQLLDEEWVNEDTARRLRGTYEFRRTRFTSRFDDGDDGTIEERSLNFQRLRRELLEAERAAIVDLRRQGVINDDVMHRLERDLDLEDARLDV